MAKTCGNCSRSNKDINYIPGYKVGYECLCGVDGEYKDVEHPPCDKWVGDIKENRNV